MIEKERVFEKAEAEREAKLIRTLAQQDQLREKVERQRKLTDSQAIDEHIKA